MEGALMTKSRNIALITDYCVEFKFGLLSFEKFGLFVAGHWWMILLDFFLIQENVAQPSTRGDDQNS